MASDAEGVELANSEAVSDVAYLPTYLPVKNPLHIYCSLNVERTDVGEQSRC